VPENLIAMSRTSPNHEKSVDIAREVSRLCTKIECSVAQGYLVKTLRPLIALHRHKGSLPVIIAATFLVVSSWKDGSRKKITSTERKKVIEAYGEQFSNKELNDWIGIVEKDLGELEWFERNPVSNVEPRKRKAEDDDKPVKLAKNITGLGIMVLFLRSLLT
jgi:hypothetical protein